MKKRLFTVYYSCEIPSQGKNFTFKMKIRCNLHTKFEGIEEIIQTIRDEANKTLGSTDAQVVIKNVIYWR